MPLLVAFMRIATPLQYLWCLRSCAFQHAGQFLFIPKHLVVYKPPPAPRLSLLFSKINPESLQATSTEHVWDCLKGMKSVYPFPVDNVGVSVSALVYLCEGLFCRWCLQLYINEPMRHVTYRQNTFMGFAMPLIAPNITATVALL